MSAAPVQTRYTPEDLLTMPDGDRYELIDGQLVERPMSSLSDYMAGEIFGRIRDSFKGKPLGLLFPEGTTYQCFPHAPEMVRKADVSFIRFGRISFGKLGVGHLRVRPDLVVEVLSPNDNSYEVDRKIADYLEAGVPLVWVVNPDVQTVEIHRPDQPGLILRGDAVLNGEDVLPGFSCNTAELFRPPDESPAGN